MRVQRLSRTRFSVVLRAEPTDPPEGREVELVVLDDEEFAPEEKARLLQAIEDGVEDFERGDHMDGFEFIAQLRAKREAAS